MYTSLRRIPHAIFWLCICFMFPHTVRSRYIEILVSDQVNFERYINNFNIFFYLIPQGESILLPVFTETDIQMSHRRRIQSRYMSKIHRSCSGCFGCVVALARARVISRVYELVASANAACTERGTLMRIAAMIEAHDRCASGRVCLRVCLCHATQGRHHIKAESTRCYGPNGRIDVRRCAQYLLTP